MFVMCANGHMVTEKSSEIGQSVYECSWYKMPLKYRMYMLLMIQHSNRAFHLSACGLMNCDLERFVNVSKWPAMPERLSEEVERSESSSRSFKYCFSYIMSQK